MATPSSYWSLFLALVAALFLCGCPIVRGTGRAVSATGEGVGSAVSGVGEAVGDTAADLAD